MPRGTAALAGWMAAVAVWAGCGEAVRPAAAPAAPGPAPASERASVLGPFLDAFWQLPLAPQGERPRGFSPAEASLDPVLCGACHPEQYAQWSSSLHARAFSPGLAGQLVEGPLAAPAEVRGCQSCHAPLAEQIPFGAGLGAEPAFDPALRARGLVCAVCHVRAHRRYGPPRRPELRAVAGPLPHGGFEARPEFSESRFCAPCHQFFDDPGVNGKPLENTYAEWRASPQAAAGRTCQGCHMPDRAHLWRGIHDPETVRAAVDADLVPLDLAGPTLRAALVLASRDVGHAFPSYVTPRVFLAAWQVDGAGVELPDTRLEAVLGREVDLAADPPREIFDTRVAAGESVKLDYALPRHPQAASLAGRVRVEPDFHYRGVFEALLASYRDPAAREAIRAAHRATRESGYVLAEFRRALPPPP